MDGSISPMKCTSEPIRDIMPSMNDNIAHRKSCQQAIFISLLVAVFSAAANPVSIGPTDIRIPKSCPTCHGNGFIATWKGICSRCQGAGIIYVEPDDKTTWWSAARAKKMSKMCPLCEGEGKLKDQVSRCPRCRGTKTISYNPCQNCKGTGRIWRWWMWRTDCDKCHGSGIKP